MKAKVGKSRHQQGFALDFGVNAASWRKLGKGATDEFKSEVGVFAESHGWDWRYELKDYPHFELTATDYGYKSLQEAYEKNKKYLIYIGGVDNLTTIDFRDASLDKASYWIEFWEDKIIEYKKDIKKEEELTYMGLSFEDIDSYYENCLEELDFMENELNRNKIVYESINNTYENEK